MSFLLKRVKGYTGRSIHHTHNFFVDDLKLYAQTTNSVKKQLDIITTFSKDIGMTFGEDKCAFIEIRKGKIDVLTMTDSFHPNSDIDKLYISRKSGG